MARGEIQYRVSQEEYLDAIANSKGRIDLISDQVGQTRQTVCARIRDDPVLNDAYSREYEAVTTLAEDRLFEAIERGEPWAIKLYLTTKGAAKGYGLKMENTGGPIIVLNWNTMANGGPEPTITVEGRSEPIFLEPPKN